MGLVVFQILPWWRIWLTSAPDTAKKVLSFVALANYYAEFIEDFQLIVRPLMKLTHKDVAWSWGVEQEEAFLKVKAAILSAPCLIHPDFEKPFLLATDASNTGMGAVLSQDGGMAKSILWPFIVRPLPLLRGTMIPMRGRC